MHKGRDLFKDNYYDIDRIKKIESEHRTIFLDIDGVLQPGTQKRHDHNNKLLKEYLYKKYNDFRYLDVKEADIGAVYYDWRPTSVGILKEILDTTLSDIVISSDWRDTNFDYLKAFLKLYDLDDYLIDVTDSNIYIPKKTAIKNYLNNHKEIKKYIVFDDSNFYEDFGANFKLVRNKYNSLTEYDLDYAKFLFNLKISPSETDDLYSFGDTSIKKELFEIDGKSILYLYDIVMKYNYSINEIMDYILADIYYKHKEIDLFLLNNELDLELSAGYSDRYGFITMNRNINKSIFSDELSIIKSKVIKKVR